MLKLEGLKCGYGSVEAVHNVSFDVPARSVLALLGPNGAGKTSTIMAIMGHVDIHGGRIILEGEDITRRRAIDRVGLGVALAPEGRQLFSDLTVDENLTVGGYARPANRDLAKRDRVFGYFPRLHERRGQLAGSLSGGEQQMLAIGRALMSRPRLLLLDEPSLGLAPLIARQIFDAIRTLNRQDGLTVLIVEQNANHALKLAHRGYVMVNGLITLQGTGAELLQRPEIRAAYLEGGRRG
jgi:branched-chain amino acid transport system ATP-binding protein